MRSRRRSSRCALGPRLNAGVRTLMAAKERITATDRIALFIGSGVVGALTGLIFGATLVVVVAALSGALSSREALFQFEYAIYLGIAFAALSALGGAIFPDETAELLGSIGRGIGNIWRLLIGA